MFVNSNSNSYDVFAVSVSEFFRFRMQKLKTLGGFNLKWWIYQKKDQNFTGAFEKLQTQKSFMIFIK
jgi:hypothetical protein